MSKAEPIVFRYDSEKPEYIQLGHVGAKPVSSIDNHTWYFNTCAFCGCERTEMLTVTFKFGGEKSAAKYWFQYSINGMDFKHVIPCIKR